MKLISKILLALLIGFSLAFGFTFLFLDLSTRPLLDQILLLFFSTAAFGYLSFSYFDMPESSSRNSPKDFFKYDKISTFVQEHRAGLLLGFLFLILYLYTGLKLNFPKIDTVDNFLDADNSTWMRRIAHPNGSQLEMRGPHPFAYLIFRPLGFLLNLFTHNFSLSAIFLTALAGSLCVFMTWFYFKALTRSTAYSILIAVLLGLSTSHFFFASVVETYIFSALLLIIFLVLLQKGETSTRSLVFAGLITFGITLTNFAQTCILFFLSRPRVRETVRFVGGVLSFGIILSMIHAVWYPSSKLFFLLSGARAEEEFAFPVFQEPHWRVIGRVILLIRTILLYTVVAPKPYVFTKEVGGIFPRFNFFKIAPETFSYSAYNGLGNYLILAWVILLVLAGVLFLIDLIRSRKFDSRVALLLCILFNFFLHLFYGYELFLYSADWAYALIFFTGISLSRFAGSRLFQSIFFVFLVFLTINQWQFFTFVFNTIAPFVK